MIPSILDLLRKAVVHYGYWAVGAALLAENAGVPVPGETALLIACFLAYSQHELRFRWIVLIATIAATAGGQSGFCSRLLWRTSATDAIPGCFQNS